MGLLRGDELVADYLARLGNAAADLPAPDRTWLVESARRRIRERAGGPGTRDEELVEVVLRELGEPESVVAAAKGEESRHAGALRPTPMLTGDQPPAPDARAHAQAADAAAPVAEDEPAEPDDRTTVPEDDDLGFSDRVGAFTWPDRDDAERDDPERGEDDERGDHERTAGREVEEAADDPDGTARFPPLFADTDPHLVLPADFRVRPAPVHLDAGPDLLTSFTGVRRELVALAALAVLPTVLGLMGFAIAIVLVALSRFWAVHDKVAVTLGFTLAGVLLSVIGAWLSATQLQESNDPGTRLATAGHSLVHSLHVLPAAIGWLAALYLGYVLVRDTSEHARR